jgi:adenosine kinase
VNLPISTSFLGRIGKDVQGEKFKTLMDEQVATCHLLVSEHARTGKVACLVEGENRTLLADLGAVEEAITEFPKIPKFSTGSLQKYDLCYLPGMFLNSSGNGILKEYHTKKSSTAVIAVNLSATFIINDDAGFERLLFAAERADIIFGNEEEWELFQNRTRNYFVKLDGGFVENGSSEESLVDFDNKIVVVTRGGKDTKVRYNFGIARESYPVNDVSTIVDTTGAGDAFVAGFLAFFMWKSNENRLNQENYGVDEMLNDKTLIQTSIKWGHAVAENCIHQIGAEIDLRGWKMK